MGNSCGRDTDPQTLRGFTAGLKHRMAQSLSSPKPPVLTIVIGNEASDADSIVCAVVYAYLKQSLPGGDAIPLIACDREDVTLRKETTVLFDKCGVNYHDLLYLNDPRVDELLNLAAKVVLVDHNKGTGPIAALDEKIHEIVDHHKDLGAHPNASGDHRIIAFEGNAASAGSCASKIAEKFLESEAGRGYLEQDKGAAARALLGVILIDTKNLDPKEKKVTPTDSAAASALMKIVMEPTQDDLFKELDAAKFDKTLWDDLTIQQCARYDYKEFTENGKTYGLSSCLCSLEVLSRKEGWDEEVERRAKNLELYGILTQVKDGNNPTKRQLMLLSVKEGVTDKAAAFAKTYSSPSLQLEEMPLEGPLGLKAFNQLNTGASRKQVAPCLGAFCKQ